MQLLDKLPIALVFPVLLQNMHIFIRSSIIKLRIGRASLAAFTFLMLGGESLKLFSQGGAGGGFEPKPSGEVSITKLNISYLGL